MKTETFKTRKRQQIKSGLTLFWNSELQHGKNTKRKLVELRKSRKVQS